MSTILEQTLDSTTTPYRVGREKQLSRTFQLDQASSTNLHDLIDLLITQSKLTKKSIHINIHLLNGGLAGLEYTETQKIKNPCSDHSP